MKIIPRFPTAQWICSSFYGGPRTTAPVPYFRTSFALPGPVKLARLSITALGLYECEINGQIVGDAVLVPGWTEFRKRVYFQTYDVTTLLAAGANAIGVLLGDGWYAGHVIDAHRQQYGERPQLLAQLEITGQDGATVRIGSDSSWKTTAGPVLESDLIMGESYDARHELGAWSTAGYDDSAWREAILAPVPDIQVELSPAPPVRRQELLPGTQITADAGVSWKPKKYIYDFRQNLSGRVRLTVCGKRGTHIRIRHAEVLDPKGDLYTENLRTARATDYYTLKGDGAETWEPRFTFHGFRYAEISWRSSAEDCTIQQVDAVVLHSDLPLTGEFSCSNPLLNQLAHNILWGQKGNFLEVPTDCPQRDERAGWTGDAQVFIRTAAFYMDVRGFFHKWLQDMRDAQGLAGEIPCTVPTLGPLEAPGDSGPAWGDAALICPWTIYRCYHDLAILREHYECMKRYLDFLTKQKVMDGIRSHPDVDSWGGFGDWLALDGSGTPFGGTPKDLIGTAFYANNADIMARTAELLDRPEDALHYRALHQAIVKAFQRRYVTPDGQVIGGTQTGYVLALHFGLLPQHARAMAGRELVRLIERNGMHLGTGFVGTPYLLYALESTGHLDTAYKLLEQETFPSWLFPVKHGATTMWEHWDGWTPEKGLRDPCMNSFNHYAYGAVGDWMVSSLAGLELDPIAAGYTKILFKPRPGGTITWAKATLRTPQGKAGIHWTLVGQELQLTLTVPAGSEAALSLPEGWELEPKGSPVHAAGEHHVIARRR